MTTDTGERLTYLRQPLWDVMKPGHRAYQPFEWQVRHMHRPVDMGYKRIILPCGRRSGKSEGVQAEVIRAAMQPSVVVRGIEHFPIIYVCGPTAELAQRVWEPIWAMFVPSEDGTYQPPLAVLYKNHDKARGIIWLKNGARLQRKSGDDPRGLQGERVTFAVVDEAQDMTDEAWANLLPALADSEGTLIAIGITRGKNRFRSLYQLGQDGEQGHYSASVPTAANPVMHEVAERAGYDDLDDYIDRFLAAGLTETEKKQHYYAEWVDEDGSVFADPAKVFTSEPLDAPIAGHTYFMGVDLAKSYDFTVAYVGDVNDQRVVAMERFQHLDYTVQIPKIVAMVKKWGVRVLHIDSRGSEGTIDFLRLALMGTGCSIVPFYSTTEDKANLISALVRDIEQGNITCLRTDTVGLKELQMFEAKVKNNVVKYGAPSGYHDDCVIALALLNLKMTKQKRFTQPAQQRPYVSFGGNALHVGPRRMRVR